jgi:glycosyltransferase involved in cell wall biosynthesis
MRIAHLGGLLSQHASGVWQMLEGLSGAQAAQGAGVMVFGIDDPAWQAGDRDRWQGGPARTLRHVGPLSFGCMPQLGRALRAFDPDVVHLHGLWMHASIVAAGWAARPGRRLVVSPHGMLAPVALAQSARRKRLAGPLFQNRCFRRAAGFHATAGTEAADIRAALGPRLGPLAGTRPVAVIPNGIADTGGAAGPWADRARRVLALGRLHPIKGYDRLLAAWAQVEPAAPGWTLEIAGPDPDGYGTELRRLAERLGLARAVIGPPRYGAARDALLAGSRLFALPSLSENFAMTVPEALVCGTPVLASTGAPWAELGPRGCGWWTAPEPDALAAVLLQAVRLPDATLSGMGAAGRAWVLEAFAWPGIARRMLDFYGGLHGPGAAGR